MITYWQIANLVYFDLETEPFRKGRLCCCILACQNKINLGYLVLLPK